MNTIRLQALCAGVMVAAAAAAHAADMQPPALRDPWVPPQVKDQARTAPRPAPSNLRSQVEAKLKLGFDAADVERRGSITRQQAVAARLGIVAEHFDTIDSASVGRVTFEDYKRFLRARGARTL
jgi:hypothetical protein